MKCFCATVSSVLLAVSFAPATTNSSTEFGFAGKEIYPVDDYIGLLQAADVNNDGRKDLVLVNNSRSKINLLINQTGVTNVAPPKPATRREINELPADARFRVESIASEKRIGALVVADLNADNRPDLAYYGEPKELVIQYNEGTNGWSAPKRWPLTDGLLLANALSHGDLTGDGRTDLLLLTERFVYLLAQKSDGTFAEPEKIPFATTARAVQVVDVNGDGRQDLLLVNWESATPFRFRLQDAAGRLGPEMFFTFPAVRSYLAENLVPQAGMHLVTVAQNSGRAQISRFVSQPAPALAGEFREGQFQVLPLPATDKARRGAAWADVDGDGRVDFVYAEPENGQLSLRLQQPDGLLGAVKSFPTLAGVSDIVAADWDGDGRNELFLLSPDEKQVGVTRLDDKGRLPFPTLVPLVGKPLAMAVGAASKSVRPALAVMVEQDDRRSLVVRHADGATRTQRLVESFKSNPSQLAWHDVDQDGLADLVALVPYEKMKLLLQVAGKDFTEVDVAPPGGMVEQPWLATADVDGDGRAELLLPQKNFIRAVVLKREADADGAGDKPGWAFSVREQINGSASNSRITGAALVAGTNGAALFLLDAERKSLTVAQRNAAGVWQAVKNVVLPMADYARLSAVALGSPQPNAVSLLGVNGVAWLPLDGSVWELDELDSYETPIQDGYLHDVVAGDLNGDGRKDLVFLETAKNHLDLVVFDAANKLVPANRWQVFEQRSFRGSRGEQPEPREAVVTDVTGDGKNDLIVLVHDRVLVYPQE